MDIIEARRIIRDDAIGKFGWGMAAATIAASLKDGKEADSDFFNDMLLCLTPQELAASTAVAVLHQTTRRSLKKRLQLPRPTGVAGLLGEAWVFKGIIAPTGTCGPLTAIWSATASSNRPKSGGATIDITYPNERVTKVHVNE